MMSETHEPPEPSDSVPSGGVDEAAPNFSARLRERTKDVHLEAERSGFIADLLRGRADRCGYATFLRNLVPAYAALETALDVHKTTPVVAVFADPRLRRLAALKNDLDALDREDDAAAANEAVEPSVEAMAYAEAIRQAATESPMGLVAHAYARYLGDLSGGQILKPLLVRTLSLDPAALTFYDFPAIPDLAAAKREMREALDAIPADGPMADFVIDEAIRAFRHNIAVSAAVQSMVH